MTTDEFYAQYPFATRKECVAAIKQHGLNGWASSGRLGGEERFRIHVIIAKPVPLKLRNAKRVTARQICSDLFDAMLEKHGDVERDEFIKAAMRKGVGRSTAQTRFADLNAGRE